MLDDIFAQTPAALRGWFPLGLPISAEAARRFDLGGAGGASIDRLRALAERGRAQGIETKPTDLIAGAVLHSVLRCLVGRALVGDLDRLVAQAREDAAVAGSLNRFTYSHPPAEGAADDGRALVEMLLLDLAETNPAMTPLRWVFHDAPTPTGPAARVIESALVKLDARVEGEPLLAVLRQPMKASPGDLTGQLDFVLGRWRGLLPDPLVDQLLRARDIIEETLRPRFEGPGPMAPVTFAGAEEEVEAFTPDRDWMTTVVLMAKLTHVWLDQLSRRYDEAITRVDQIPDAELDRMAEWGITGLWLIGLWQRSAASATIKRKMGNPEAIASAYSLHDYVIADDLGGPEAYAELRARCRKRGIRLAADMVPNHVGVDGRWVMEHPERFLQLDRPPYPNYRFTGPDLSLDAGVSVRLEDGYWNRSDAAVVFERRDLVTGEVRYIYHGNDGTQMPWNDTAQIDYLNPEAREAVIQMILEVARGFDIIRFDAAMTLARRHIRRLWHPAPGDGGAVPSRAEHGVDPDAFEEAMPAEFWREVVDRVQAEVPDTLLLAEAFWLMEGYFVRTLGMHRVYNSAFMHMLKDEDNAGYRRTIANTLAFSPAVLQRFVNFMNNPDEETAVAQFGKGDKYFGVATLLVTLPGLPMIGHGQVQGFAEKYGMEYRRAYRDEVVDAALVERHARQIFPLMRRRHLFSEADHFALYDFVTDAGAVDENVFAYSNREGDERAVVLYNNAYGRAAGRFAKSVPINIAAGGETELVTRTLGEALDLADDDTLYAFRDHVGGLSHLRTGAEIHAEGLAAALDGYQTKVFLDWRALEDDPAWRQLAEDLAGAGVPDLDEARRSWVMRPALDAFDGWLAAVLDGIDPDEAWRAFEALAAPHGVLSGAPSAAKAAEASTRSPTALRAVTLAGVLGRLTPQGRVDVRERAIEATDAETVALAEALVEGGPLSGAPEDVVAEWSTRVAGPAARAWLGVHRHEGVRWYREERMSALVEAHAAVAEADGRDPAALVLAEKTLRTHLDAARWRYDAVLAPTAAPVEEEPEPTEP